MSGYTIYVSTIDKITEDMIRDSINDFVNKSSMKEYFLYGEGYYVRSMTEGD